MTLQVIQISSSGLRAAKSEEVEAVHIAGESLRGANLQDILRLLTLWFSHGNSPDVEAALKEGFGNVSIDTWLVVIPQASNSSCLSILSPV